MESPKKSELNISSYTDSVLKSSIGKKPEFDSIIYKYNTASEDTSKLNYLLKTRNYLNSSTSLRVIHDLICNSKKLGYYKGEYLGYIHILYSYAKIANEDSVEFYHSKINDWAIKNNELDYFFSSEIYYGYFFFNKKNYPKCDSILSSVIDRMDETKNKNQRLKLLVNYYYGKSKHVQYENDQAKQLFNTSVTYSDSLKEESLLADIYFQIGECYIVEGDYNNSLEAYGKAVIYAEKNDNKRVLSSALGAIGEIYLFKEDVKKAIINLEKGISIAKEIDYKYQIGYSGSVLSNAYLIDSNFTKAKQIVLESNQIFEELGKENYKGDILLNTLYLSNIYLALDSLDKAAEIINSVFINLSYFDDASVTAETFTCLAEINLRKNQLDKAREFALMALKVSIENGLTSSKKATYEILYKTNEKKRNFEQAFNYFKKFTRLSDSLTNKSQIKLFAEMENEIKQNKLKAEHDKKEADLLKQRQKKDDELKQQRATSIGVTIGLVAALIFVVLIYRSLQDNKKKAKIIAEQKREVESQKEIIEEKKKELTDSIDYAKKIQEAILPSIKSIKDTFSDSFVFYKPKDVVAGDFYWLEKVEDVILIAAGDCTGHGVPGAMVSVVCSNALNRSVKEFGLSDPGDILNKVREIVIDTFEKSGSEVKDGMDISLVAIQSNDKNKCRIKWAGANNPLWYISNGELTEIKAQKQPVGKFVNQQAFESVQLELEKDTVLYLITDGFADQFGGPKGKKFKYKNLKELLIANSHEPLDKQSLILEKNFYSWKLSLEQVDDVTVIGIKV